jgi:hypothetical protein
VNFKTDQELLEYCLKGDLDAINFVHTISRISQFLDDHYDGDLDNDPGVRKADAIVHAMDVLIHLPRNLFYSKWFAELQPVLELGLNDWIAANEFENKAVRDDEKRDYYMRIAYVIRDNCYSIVVTCARIIGGPDWAAEISPILREYIHSESFEDYMSERVST